MENNTFGFVNTCYNRADAAYANKHNLKFNCYAELEVGDYTIVKYGVGSPYYCAYKTGHRANWYDIIGFSLETAIYWAQYHTNKGEK
uniref:Uncharacterized protein n=1 Tax=viral metagenome TaxID=1070528 RepID=A0A6M3LPK3_9ZZZZ